MEEPVLVLPVDRDSLQEPPERVSSSPALTFKTRCCTPPLNQQRVENRSNVATKDKYRNPQFNLHCRACRTSAAPGGGSTATPAIDLVNLEPPASAQSEARNFTALNQP